METRTTGVYRERAERRRRTRGEGEARGDGWQRTEEDEHLLRLATRYSTLTLHQAAYACWGGRIEAARRRVRLMTEAGLLLRSADVRWARTVVWTTERGARVAGTGLSAPRPPGERLLHCLAVADAGIALEAHGYAVLSEREVHAAEAVPGRAAELLAALRVPGVPASARRGETLAVPVGARAVHWPDLVTVPPGGRLPVAVEVELTPKPTATLGRSCGPTGTRSAAPSTSAPPPSFANCRALRVRTAGGSTASPRTSACSRRAGPIRALVDSCGSSRSPPSTPPLTDRSRGSRSAVDGPLRRAWGPTWRSSGGVGGV